VIVNSRSAGKKASIAKITRPDSVGLIPRKRLFDLLDRSWDSSIIFATGPPGSGKTSLIASYTDVQKIPCIWYKIDEGDSDVATFFYYMGMAAKKITPPKKKSLPVFTPEYIHEASLFSRRYFEELFTRVETPFVIVFDNYQEVPSHSGFHEMIAGGFSDIPGGINIFLLSRKAPPLSFAQVYTGDRFCCIGWDEIRFTFEEAREVVRLKVTSSISDETIHYFHEKTDGWAAGLVLMLQSYKENINYRMLDKISSGKIFDYFAHEIFQKLERDTQEFLLKTSFFPEMTARMAGQLVDTRSAKEILERLKSDCCFIDSCFEEKPVYHYHPLFRDFLRAVARDFFGEEDLSRINKTAATLLEESGMIEDAVRLFRDCGDLDGLTRVIQNWAHSLVKQGRYQTLHDWLNSLPVDILSGNPWLRYWTGISRLPFNPDESMNQFETAFHQFGTRKEAEGVFLSWSGMVESIIYGSEGLEPLDRWIFSFEELL
jgi:LuxR family transcriptional regulator, maltose regulon positive regulatory protein